ncbi:MAG: transposase [Eubacterium sp.]|nr:transposase [Eubacterium sp.]
MINYNRLGYEIKRDLSKFSSKISKGLKRPQQKFIHQMLYGILAADKVHLSEIARSLKEDITLKKTIERLSRNLNAFDGKQALMQDYLSLVKQHVKDDYAVIVIDNSDIAKPKSRKLEALSEIRDGSTGEITQGYLTIEAAVLSETGKMPLPVYEKVFSAAEEGFISETHENLCCLESLSGNFSRQCVRTLDRGFDANEYYRYFLKRKERFVIRAKKNRNVIYNGKTCGIMDAALKYKGNYRMDFKDKDGNILNCKISCIPVKLCEFPEKELTLVAVYGFGAEPMLLLSNLKMQEKKKLCHIVTKVYLMRWRIEEYFKFKKQQFELEDLRVMSLQSIRSLNLFATLAAGYIGLSASVHAESIFLTELKECSRRIYKMPKFIFYALGYAIERVLSMSRKGINSFFPKRVRTQQMNLFEHFKIEDAGAFVF